MRGIHLRVMGGGLLLFIKEILRKLSPISEVMPKRFHLVLRRIPTSDEGSEMNR